MARQPTVGEVTLPATAITVETDLGLEMYCPKCDDFWPADTDFFFVSKGQLRQPCKACYYELPSVIAKNKRRAAAA